MVVTGLAAYGLVYCMGLGFVQVSTCALHGVLKGGRKAVRKDFSGAAKSVLGGIVAPIAMTGVVLQETARHGLALGNDIADKVRGRVLVSIEEEDAEERGLAIRQQLDEIVPELMAELKGLLQNGVVATQTATVPAVASNGK